MNQKTVQSIDVKSLKALWEKNPELLIIDVREPYEWQQAHISGTVHIPKDTLLNKISDIAPDKTKPVYIHCKSGGRSLMAGQQLVSMGYQEVFNVEGGILDWARWGYPIEEGEVN